MAVMDSPSETPIQNDKPNLRRYWYFWIPTAIFLAIMVKFPLRFVIGESLFDIVFYGAIAVDCVVTVIRVYRRFGNRALRVISLILLCFVLSGWQVFDLAVLRYQGSPASGFSSFFGKNEFEGMAWYNLRFRRDDIMCHSLI